MLSLSSCSKDIAMVYIAFKAFNRGKAAELQKK